MATTASLLPALAPFAWPPQLQLAVAAWLTEVGQDSVLTRRDYESTLSRFVIHLQLADLTLHAPAGQVKIAAERFAAERFDAKGNVSAVTRNKRLSVLSSFYRYAITSELLPPPNPIDLIKRPKRKPYARARALDVGTVKQRIAAIDRSELVGLRDYALLTVALTTGRRLRELAGLRCRHVQQLSDESVQLTWERTKGGGMMYDTLPLATTRALLAYLDQLYESQRAGVSDNAPVWVSVSNYHRGGALSISAIADICEQRLGTSKVHQLRHTFAHLMEDKGAKVSEIQQRLGHASAATTSIYLQALRSDENRLGEAVAEALGVE